MALCTPGRRPQEKPALPTPPPRTCSLQERGWENVKVCVEAAQPRRFAMAAQGD